MMHEEIAVVAVVVASGGGGGDTLSTNSNGRISISGSSGNALEE